MCWPAAASASCPRAASRSPARTIAGCWPSSCCRLPTGAGASFRRVLRFARREPSAILLFGQLLGVLLYPFMEGSDAGRALFSVFGIAILGLVVLAVRSTRGLTSVAVFLGVPATVLLLIQAVTA